MRARAGDPPRTMAEKLVSGRAASRHADAELMRLPADQVAIVHSPEAVLTHPSVAALERVAVETAVVYEPQCVRFRNSSRSSGIEFRRNVLRQGMQVAKAGLGFAATVHSERFGGPARLLLTDEPRLAALGATGTLSLVVGPEQLADALCTGSSWVRPMRSLQLLLSGKLRPFVAARDAALELLRTGLADRVRDLDRSTGCSVILEFGGAGIAALSVGERAVLAALAPRVGAGGALFPSDARTASFLSSQRRMKAYRSLAADPGAAWGDIVSLNLSAIDPLILDEFGTVRQVRELSGSPLSQAILGGDSGAGLLDLLVSSKVLKCKRLAAHLELLVAPPTRQVLDAIVRSGALADLLGTGARLIEPDAGLLDGSLYPPPPGGVSLRTFDPEPLEAGQSVRLTSAETAAWSVARGSIQDPREMKRPVRVTIPRSLNTEDSLLLKKLTGHSDDCLQQMPRPRNRQSSFPPSGDRMKLRVATRGEPVQHPTILVLNGSKDSRWLLRNAANLVPHLRAAVAERLPSPLVSVLSSLGVLACLVEPEQRKLLLRNQTVTMPAAEEWPNDGGVRFCVRETAITARWAAAGLERKWVLAAAGSGSSNVQ